MKVPIIKNIHAKVLEAVSRKGALKMSDWHTCETTHCRAGWVIHLAGNAGYKLEKSVGSTPFAASLIYDKSSNVRVPEHLFYDTKQDAMASIKRCAKLERNSI